MTLFGTFFEENRSDLQRKSVKMGIMGSVNVGNRRLKTATQLTPPPFVGIISITYPTLKHRDVRK